MITNVVESRMRFAEDFASGQWSMTELCERYGVTRPTGYKWVARHRAGGDRALEDRSRAPHHCTQRTDAVPGSRVAGAQYAQRAARPSRPAAQEPAPTEVGAPWRDRARPIAPTRDGRQISKDSSRPAMGTTVIR